MAHQISQRFRLVKEKSLELLKESSTHGVAKLILANRLLVRILWSITLIFSIVFCSLMISRNISDFLSYDVVTKIKQEKSNPTVFPTVTICNINSFIKNSSFELMYQVIARVKNISLDEARKTNYLNQEEKFNTIDNFKISAMNPAFGDQNRQALGYSIEEILITCKFDYKTCNETDFEWW